MRRAVLIWLWLLWAALCGAAGCTVVSVGEPVEPDPEPLNLAWERSFGEEPRGAGHAVQQTADGGFIIAGQAFPEEPNGTGEPFLLRTDAAGVRQWRRDYGSGGGSTVYAVQQTAAGGFIAAGRSRREGENEGKVYLLQTGADGATQWERFYGGADSVCARSVVPDRRGGYAVCGLVELPDGGSNLYLLKTGVAGHALWEGRFGRGAENSGQFVLPAGDGGLLAVGWTKAEEGANRDVYAVKVDAGGGLEWEGIYGGTEDEIGFFARPEEDGGYTIAGQYFTYATGGTGVYLVRIDDAGEVLWEKHAGGSDRFLGLSVQPAGEDGYLVLGQAVGPDGYRHIALAGFDRDGLLAWETIFGGAGDAAGLAAIQTAEGDYVVTGWNESPGSGRKDVYLARLKP